LLTSTALILRDSLDNNLKVRSFFVEIGSDLVRSHYRLPISGSQEFLKDESKWQFTALVHPDKEHSFLVRVDQFLTDL